MPCAVPLVRLLTSGSPTMKLCNVTARCFFKGSCHCVYTVFVSHISCVGIGVKKMQMKRGVDVLKDATFGKQWCVYRSDIHMFSLPLLCLGCWVILLKKAETINVLLPTIELRPHPEDRICWKETKTHNLFATPLSLADSSKYPTR